MATENTIKFKIEANDNALEVTKNRIKELKAEMLKAQDADTFNKLALEAGQLETEIRRVQDAVTSLAGSGSELTKMSNSFNRVGASLLSMDFGAAAEEAGRLAAISKTMNFGSAISSLKSLGSTFMSLGKALLTNPFFLLVGVVVAIGVAIYKLMDELGLITKVFDAVGEAIQYVIDKLKEMLDWFGLTDYAGEKQAENVVANNEKIEKSVAKLSAKQTEALDHEIAMRQLAGEDTKELEREKLATIQASLTEQIRLAQEKAKALIRLHGKNSDEYKAQIEAIESLEAQQLASLRSIEVFEATQQKKIRDKEKAEADAKKKTADERRKQRIADEEKEAKAIADARLKADLLIEKAKIEFIDDEIEQARQMAIFNEQQSYEQIDRKRLTDEQIEILEQQHKDRLVAIEQDATDKKQAIIDKHEADKQALREKENLAEAEAERKRIEEFQKANDKILEIEQLTQDGKKQLIDGALNAISANAKEGSKLAKGLAVGQATIDTYRGATAAFATTAANPISIAFPAAPYLAAASAVAMGIANVRKILATKTDGASGGGGGGSTFTAPSLGSRQEVSNTPSMNLNNSQEQNAGGSTTRGQVMVVDYTDIANKGKEQQGLLNRVSLG